MQKISHLVLSILLFVAFSSIVHADSDSVFAKACDPSVGKKVVTSQEAEMCQLYGGGKVYTFGRLKSLQDACSNTGSVYFLTLGVKNDEFGTAFIEVTCFKNIGGK